ncbi:hypothetical protein PSHT_14861 [Puccinia striiformis]|uniref:Uncharacterized protein n=1 Tax=Puccinia striiformis TaxID=27350 RepID=A0A2S4UI10_9BASI|nr:hypothetical protein PSHT_14861 [Puccinia striiformis]
MVVTEDPVISDDEVSSGTEMQHLLRSIYNDRWFPFQSIPLSSSSSSPKSSSSSSEEFGSVAQPSPTPIDQDHQFQLSSSDPRLIANQFHLLQVTSTSLSISVSLSSSASLIPNQLIHPIININSQPWYKLMLLDQAPPTNSQAETDQEDSSLPSLRILIYGLAPGTVYDVDVELTLVDQHIASDSSAHMHAQLADDDDQPHLSPKLNSPSTIVPELNDRPSARRDSHQLKPSDSSDRLRPAIPQIEPDGPPPPYTSYDPASPTPTHTSEVVRSSSHSFSSLESSFADTASPETSVDSSAGPDPRTINNNTDEETQLVLRDKQIVALREAIKENAPLKQSLDDLEQLIKRLDEENLRKSSALLIYDESKMVEFEKKVEDQKEELKLKTEEYHLLEQKNQQKLDNLQGNNQVLKTRWEDSVKEIGDFKDKTMKPIEDEIEELTRQISECEREIKFIDREIQKRVNENSKQFQVVRSRSSSKKPNVMMSNNKSRGLSKESTRNNNNNNNNTHHHQGNKNHRQSKWRSMDDFKFMNPSHGRRAQSTNPIKRDTLDETYEHSVKSLRGSSSLRDPSSQHNQRSVVYGNNSHNLSPQTSPEKHKKHKKQGPIQVPSTSTFPTILTTPSSSTSSMMTTNIATKNSILVVEREKS